MQTATSRALVTIFRTMPKNDQLAFAEWIKKHEKEIENSSLSNDLEEEKNNFLNLSAVGLNRVFSDDEPTYSLEDCIEIKSNLK